MSKRSVFTIDYNKFRVKSRQSANHSNKTASRNSTTEGYKKLMVTIFSITKQQKL